MGNFKDAQQTIASTRAGIPRSGHTNKRAVAAQNTTSRSAATAMRNRRRRGRPGPAVRGFWAARNLVNGRPS